MNRILHVDLDERFRREFCDAVGREGMTCVGADTCAQATHRLKSEEIFCLVLDADVADLDWAEAIRLFGSIRHGLPVILTTGRHTKELEAAARLANVTYYFVKSFSILELAGAVREILTALRKGRDMDTEKKTILVIDDDPDYQDAVKAILESGGYSVIQAYSKEEGQATLKRETPDLIVLDIMMETSSAGFHFLYETLGDRDDPVARIPILAVSSISQKTAFKFSPTDHEDFFPADDYLEKPVGAEALLRHVGILLEGRVPEGAET